MPRSPIGPGSAAEQSIPAFEPVIAQRGFFVSGHSLTASPMPDFLSRLMSIDGNAVPWSELSAPGATLRHRNGLAPPPEGVAFMLITEQHGLLGSLVWHDTRGELLKAGRAFNSRNPGAPVYFYVPWLAVDDLTSPGRWIAYERAATPVWRCALDEVNGRPGGEAPLRPIRFLPANLALAEWVEAEGTAGLFEDDVHLTAAGKFYLALVVYASVAGPVADFGIERVASVAPAGLSATQVAQMVASAQAFVSTWQDRVSRLSGEECNAYLESTFRQDYWNYFRAAHMKGTFPLLARWRQWRLDRSAGEIRFSSH